jgi:hypothetical protein
VADTRGRSYHHLSSHGAAPARQNFQDLQVQEEAIRLSLLILLSITWSIDLSRISEFEPRQRDERHSARRSWPVSARFAVGTMVVLNLILIAFLVKNEFTWSKLPEVPASVKVDVPRNVTGIEPQPLGNLAPVQDSKPDVYRSNTGEADQAKTDAMPVVDSRQKIQEIHPQPAKTPARPFGKLKVDEARQAAVSTTRRWEATTRYSPTPASQARFAPPQSQPSRVPAPIPAAVAAPVPAPSSGTSTPPAMVASVRTPTVGTPTMVGGPASVGAQKNSDTQSKVIAPTSSLPKADANQRPPAKVASVSLPSMVKGWVPPKMATDSGSPKIQVVHRPPEPKADVPNCGGAVVIPCPTLKKRPAGGTPEGDRW